MIRSKLTAAVALGCVGLLAACAEQTNGTPTGVVRSVGSTSPSSNSTAVPASFPQDLHTLSAKIAKALAATSSVHIKMTFGVTVGPQSQTFGAEGDQTVVNGRSKDSVLTLSVPQYGSEKLIKVNGVGYVMLPPKYQTDHKPWAKLSVKSSNDYVRTLAVITKNYNLSGPDAAQQLLNASDKLTIKGKSQLADGTEVVTYRLRVVTARLPRTSSQSITALERAGIKYLPIQMSIDADAHIRGLTENIKVTQKFGSKKITVGVSTSIAMSDYNAPVSISPPPADEITTD